MKTSRRVAAAVLIGSIGRAAADAAAPGAVDVPGDVMGGAMAPLDIPSTVTDFMALETLDPPYTAYPSVDYGPLTIPPPLVPIEDLPGGDLLVADAIECAMECSALPGCNAASYYGDNPSADWPGMKNCYLKGLTGCELPMDAVPTADATIFLIGGLDCAAAPLAVDAMMPLPMADAPLGPLLVDTMTPIGAPIAVAEGPLTPPALPPLPTALPPITAVAPTEDRALAPAPSTLTSTGLDPPAQSVDTFPPVTSAPSAAPSALQGAAAAVAVLGAALML